MSDYPPLTESQQLELQAANAEVEAAVSKLGRMLRHFGRPTYGIVVGHVNSENDDSFSPMAWTVQPVVALNITTTIQDSHLQATDEDERDTVFEIVNGMIDEQRAHHEANHV